MTKNRKRPQGNVYVFSSNGMNFYGGGSKGKCDSETVDFNIILNATDGCSSWWPGRFKNLKHQIRHDKYIRIVWPNYRTLGWPREGYEELLKELRNLKEGEMDVLVSCMGGLGRTGTMLAIFATILGEVRNPVKYIRKHYMKDAIETKQQEELVRKIKSKAPMMSLIRWQYTIAGYPYARHVKAEARASEEEVRNYIRETCGVEPEKVYPSWE